MFKKRSKYEDQASDAGAAGGGASVSADAGQAGAAQAAGAGAGAAEAGGQAPSVLGGTPQGQEQAPDTSPFNWIPEKFRVSKDDGAIDLEASAKKVEEHRANLEKRLGSGDIPPKTPEEYAPTVEADEGFDVKAFMADEGTKGFLKGAHAKGMTNEQVSYVLSQYAKTAPLLVKGSQVMDMDAVQANLRETWKDDAEYNRNIDAYWNTAHIIARKAGIEYDEESSGLARNPTFVKMMAAISKEFQEDTPPGSASPVASDDIKKLMASEAYNNPKHIDHERVSKQVQEHFQRTYGTAAAL